MQHSTMFSFHIYSLQNFTMNFLLGLLQQILSYSITILTETQLQFCLYSSHLVNKLRSLFLAILYFYLSCLH